MHRSERGFSLLEAIVAIALTTGVLLAATTAVTRSLHATSLEATKSALRDDALSALADVRAATAYDGVLLASMVGRSSTATIGHGASLETIAIAISRGRAPAATILATATATRNGATVREQITLYNEAPAPGSTVEQ